LGSFLHIARSEGYLRPIQDFGYIEFKELIERVPPCQYQSEKCRAHVRVIVVAPGKQLLQLLQIANSANNQSFHIQPAQHVAPITAAKL